MCVSVNSLAWHSVAHPRSWLGSSCPLLANTDRWCLSEGSAISCHASGAGQKATETINDKPIRVTSFNYVRRLNQSESCSLSHTALSHFSTYRWPMQVPDLNSLIFQQQKWRWQKTTLKSANASSPNLCSKRKLEIFCEWCISFYNFFYLHIFNWMSQLDLSVKWLALVAYAGYFQWFSFLKPCPFLHLTISWHSGLPPQSTIDS